MALDDAQRKLRARGAALAMHAKGSTNTRPAREAFMDRFRRQVDPDMVLSEAEREKRALAARKSHMTMLALKSSIKRSSRKAQ
jgi:hypothetical protein